MTRVAHRRPVAFRPLVLLGVSLVLAACSASSGATPAPPTGEASPATSTGTVPGANGAGEPTACPTTQPAPLPAGEARTVTLETDKGAIVIRIEADLSPIAAGNFVTLASCGYYDGVVFHRVVPAFVIQGGDPTGRGNGGPGYTIQDEPVTATYSRGTVAMARTSQPNSVGSQFFIVLDDAARAALAQANTYQIIGSVSSGMDAVDAIAAAAGGEELPGNPVTITRASVSNP